MPPKLDAKKAGITGKMKPSRLQKSKQTNIGDDDDDDDDDTFEAPSSSSSNMSSYPLGMSSIDNSMSTGLSKIENLPNMSMRMSASASKPPNPFLKEDTSNQFKTFGNPQYHSSSSSIQPISEYESESKIESSSDPVLFDTGDSPRIKRRIEELGKTKVKEMLQEEEEEEDSNKRDRLGPKQNTDIRKDEFKTTLTSCKSENDELQTTKDKLYEELQALLAELETLTKELDDLRTEQPINQNNVEGKIYQIEAKQLQVDEALQKYCYTVENCEEALENCDEQLEDLKKQFGALKARFDALEAENKDLQSGLADKLFSDPYDLGAEGEGAEGEYMGDVGAGVFIPVFSSPPKQIDSALNAYASGYARELGKYSAMANEIVARAVQENNDFIVSNDNMTKYTEEYQRQKLKGDENINVSYTVADPAKTFTQYQIDSVRLLEIFAENNCFMCWRDIRANIDRRELPWTVGISGALTIADLLISSLDYTYMILTSTPFMGVFTDVKKYPSINQFIKEKNALYKVAFATTQSRTTLESVEVLTLTTLVVLSLSELIYATYYNPLDCVENVAAQNAVADEIENEATGQAKKSKDTKKKAKDDAKENAPIKPPKKGSPVAKTPEKAVAKAPGKASGKASGKGAAGDPAGDPAGEMKPLIFATVNLMCKFLSTKSLLDVGISAVLYKFMKCTTNKGFAFFTSDGSAASDASIRGVPTYSQITFYVGETTTLLGNIVDKYNCKRVFCIDDPAIAGYLWIVKNAMTRYEAFKQMNPRAGIISFLDRQETPAELGYPYFDIFMSIYFMGENGAALRESINRFKAAQNELDEARNELAESEEGNIDYLQLQQNITALETEIQELAALINDADQNPGNHNLLYSTIYDDATSLASDGVMSTAFTAMLETQLGENGPTIYEQLNYIGYNEIGYGFDADLYKCSTLSRLMFNKKFGRMTEPEFQKYITMTTLDYMRHDYEGKGGGAKPSSVRYLLLGLNLMRKMRRFKLDEKIGVAPVVAPAVDVNVMSEAVEEEVEAGHEAGDEDAMVVDVDEEVEEDDDYNYDYSWVTTLTVEQVTALMSELQAELTPYDKNEIELMSNKEQFEKYLKIYKDAITPAGIFYWPLHPSLVPGAKIMPAPATLPVDDDNARKQLFNTYLYMAAKSVADYEGDLFREELHMYGITSKGTPRVWLAGINKLAVKKTHDSVLNNVNFISVLAARNILLGNTAIPQGENGVVDLQLSLSSINTQAKSVIGIDATNSADGNSGTTEDPRSTTVVEYLRPTQGFVNGLQICTIYSGSNSTGIVYSPQDIWDIEFLNGAILCSIRPENFVMIEKTAPAIIKKLSEFAELPEVKAEIAKITLNPPPLQPQTEELKAALDAVEAVKKLVPKPASLATPFKLATPSPFSAAPFTSSSTSISTPILPTSVSSSSSSSSSLLPSFSSPSSSSSARPSKVKDIFRKSNQVSRKAQAQARRSVTSSSPSSSPSPFTLSSSAPAAVPLTAAVVSVLGDINIESVNETTKTAKTAKPATVEELAQEAKAETAVTTFKGSVETQLKTFSGKFTYYLPGWNFTTGKKTGKIWPVQAVKDTFIKIIQENLRLLVVNINTAYNTMLKSITEMAFSIVAVMSINAAVNTIFGILYTTLASQVQVFQEEQKALMAEPDVKIRVLSRKTAANAKTAALVDANPIAYKAFNSIDIPIFPVDAAIMTGGGINDDSQPKSKSKNKDTRSFKVKGDKKTSRKKK